MTKTYKEISRLTGWRGDARLYELSEPIEFELFGDGGEYMQKKTNFVIVSAVVAMVSGPETYIFPAESTGKALSFAELDGSFRGRLDHDAALRGAGYQSE